MAKWILKMNNDWGSSLEGFGADGFYCGKCNHFEYRKMRKYCPECGTKMDANPEIKYYILGEETTAETFRDRKEKIEREFKDKYERNERNEAKQNGKTDLYIQPGK